MKTICLVVLFGTLLCGSGASSGSSEDSDSDKSDASVDVLTDIQGTETTAYCNSFCNCLEFNGKETTYCCPDGKPDPNQCPGSIVPYDRYPGMYDISPTAPEVVQYLPPVISPGNTNSYGEYLDWIQHTTRADYVTNYCNSRLGAVLGGCRRSAYTDPCFARNCKPAQPIYNRCTTRKCNPVPTSYTGCTVNYCPPVTTSYNGCTTTNCNTASRCCRPQVATNHLRDAVWAVVSQSYTMSKGEFIAHIEAVIARQREYDWDPVMVRGSNGVNWPNNWPVYKQAGVPPTVDTTDDADEDVTLEDSTETKDQSL